MDQPDLPVFQSGEEIENSFTEPAEQRQSPVDLVPNVDQIMQGSDDL